MNKQKDSDLLTLEEYKKKRDFIKTPEPKDTNKENSSKNRSIFVIQKHDASHLHYDLRLEIDNVLKSWAIPKSPPLKIGIKRLAVQTEDHPLSYANFHGLIPKGQYGAGKVEIWDKGDFEVLDLKENKIVVDINGEKIKGKYCLIKLKPKVSQKNGYFLRRTVEFL